MNNPPPPFFRWVEGFHEAVFAHDINSLAEGKEELAKLEDKACHLAWQNTLWQHSTTIVSMPTLFYLVCLLEIVYRSTHLVWLPRDQWYRKYRIDKHPMKIWTSTVILTLNTTIQYLHRTLRNMIMYYPIKFSCKKSRVVQQIW